MPELISARVGQKEMSPKTLALLETWENCILPPIGLHEETIKQQLPYSKVNQFHDKSKLQIFEPDFPLDFGQNCPDFLPSYSKLLPF